MSIPGPMLAMGIAPRILANMDAQECWERRIVLQMCLAAARRKMCSRSAVAGWVLNPRNGIQVQT